MDCSDWGGGRQSREVGGLGCPSVFRFHGYYDTGSQSEGLCLVPPLSTSHLGVLFVFEYTVFYATFLLVYFLRCSAKTSWVFQVVVVVVSFGTRY